ncbi:MAG: DUF4870 domain-containing protein [Xanthomonadaceae bacterium]|nr:DUF4870 domain-containing protein [Xanthomonadaceae bacterium]MDP2184197.1 DUF4870 domain-containing protein [Xanthomonadales bacterium]MDZ4114743.1 DUF4870 domain-containing protein [Xanthomonadaceae bacterium]MDZ4379042.1 DUF4870 domain-containing protein [Xanthomonadaceae bacterium]
MTDFDKLTEAPAAGSDRPDADQRTWGMFCHLAALSAFFSGIGFLLGPLIVWLIKRDEMPFVNDQGKEALNFNITVLIACVALWIVTLVTFGLAMIFTIPLMVVVGLVWLIVTIVAAIKANEGEYYRYPFALRLIK